MFVTISNFKGEYLDGVKGKSKPYEAWKYFKEEDEQSNRARFPLSFCTKIIYNYLNAFKGRVEKMKPIKIEQEGLKEAIKSGKTYIQVGNKKFLLVEVEEVNKNDFYVVSDKEEETKLLEALNKYNPILSEEEMNKSLRR